MSKILKTSLIALAGIAFFGINFAATPVAHAAAPTIKSLSVTPDPATAGTNIVITWASDADNCYLSGTPWDSFPNKESPAQSATGTWSQAQAINTGSTPQPMTIKLRCENATALPDNPTPILESSNSEKTITVNPGNGTPVITLSTNPADIPAGTQTMNITWSASNTNLNGCVASSPNNVWSGTKASNGTAQIPATLGTYNLTCTGPGGSSTKSYTVAASSGLGSLGGTVAPGTSTTDLSKLKCLSWNEGMNVGACAAITLYYVIYIPSSWLLYGAGYIFDATLKMSIEKDFIVKPFINDLWVIVRDFSNMLFIFILLYTGIQTMIGGKNWQRTVINVILIALLINFSLFFTKVVIDAGNVLAVGVYSSMGSEKAVQTTTGNVKERSISADLVAGFNPQSFIGSTAVTEPLDAIVIFLISAAVSIFTAYVFFMAALLFLGRLLAFWYLMVVSPFAFTSIVLPKWNMFGSWSGLLIDQAFVAPVYLFLVYLIMKVISTGLLKSMLNSSSAGISGFFFDKLIIPIILAAMIIMALKAALGVAKKMSGDFGSAASKFAGQAIGATVAVASGGAALAAGAAGKAALASSALQDAAKSQNIFKRGYGKLGLLAADQAQKSTFDVRNIGGLAGEGISSLGLGKGAKMTYESQTKNWRESREKWNEKMAGVMEVPKEQIEAAKREVANLDRLVQLAEDAAKNSPAGITIAATEKAEKETKEKLAEAKKNEDEALAELKKAKDSGDQEREAAARTSLEAITAEVKASSSAYATAKKNSAAAAVVYAATPEVQEINNRKKEKENADNVVKALTKESDARREVYAQQVVGSVFGSRARREERASKIRAGSSTAKKQKETKDEEKLSKVLQKIAEQAAKTAPSTPVVEAPAPEAPKP